MRERSLIWRLRARLRGERGFTMIEVAVAMIMFGVLISAIATTQSSTMNLIRSDRSRSVAANLAAEEMDTVRATSFTELGVGRTETPQDVDGIMYTVTRDAEWVLGDADSGACDAPADATPKYLSVNVYVSWPIMSGVKPVDSHTLITPPVGTYDETTGHIGVKVLDRDGAPVSGVLISLAGPQSESQITTADGCAFFAFLPAGSYTATASASGYVSDQGLPAPSQAATVTVGTTTSMQFDYDRAATLDVTLVGKDLGAPAPSSVSVVLVNSHIVPSGTKLVPGAGSPRQIASLYPFADGYGVRAGTCADAIPEDPPVAVTQGGATAVTVPLPEVLVTDTIDVAGIPTPVIGATVQAVHAADASCTAGETFSVGATDLNGQLTFALPYGTWTVNVGGVPVLVELTPGEAPADADGFWPFDVVVAQ